MPPTGWILKPPLCVSEAEVCAAGVSRKEEGSRPPTQDGRPWDSRLTEAPLPHLAENQGLGGKSINRNA